MSFLHKILPTWSGREGILIFDVERTPLFGNPLEYQATVVVGEVEQRGNKSKLAVHSISGIDRRYYSKIRDMVPEWIDSDRVGWLQSPPTTPLKASKEIKDE